jgi:hypothetical protein
MLRWTLIYVGPLGCCTYYGTPSEPEALLLCPMIELESTGCCWLVKLEVHSCWHYARKQGTFKIARGPPRRSRVGDPGGKNLASPPHYRSPPPSSHRRRGGLRVGEAPNDVGGAAISPSRRSCGGRGRHGSSWSSPAVTSSTAVVGARAHRSGTPPSGSNGRVVGGSSGAWRRWLVLPMWRCEGRRRWSRLRCAPETAAAAEAYVGACGMTPVPTTAARGCHTRI